MINYGGQSDPRGGGLMATADVFERHAIRDTQITMERCAIPKQAFLDPWRENYSLFRGEAGKFIKDKPKVSVKNRRSDIPAPVQWLQYDENPEVKDNEVKMEDDGPPPAGGAHEYLGIKALNGNQGKAGRGSRFYHRLTAGFSEEEKRQFLITGERRRRYSHIKFAPTDTLGTGAPLPLSHYKGGYTPTGPKYKSGEPNPWPKLAIDPVSSDRARSTSEGAHTFDPWNTTRWGGDSALGTTNQRQQEAFRLD
jgi:hypothetical protein